MMTSKDRILNKLRSAQQPFGDVEPVKKRLPMVKLADKSPGALRDRFVLEAEKLGCTVYHCPANEILQAILQVIGKDKAVLSWDQKFIPLPDLNKNLAAKNISIAEYNDSHVRVGITGVDAALAATGSLVVTSGKGKYRTASLLPDIHIAVMTEDQIVADWETWLKSKKRGKYATFRKSSNVLAITGPSKTADIAQILIKGAHGPREVHIMIVT